MSERESLLTERAEGIAHRLLEHDPETCPSQDETSEVLFALVAEIEGLRAEVDHCHSLLHDAGYTAMAEGSAALQEVEPCERYVINASIAGAYEDEF